MTDTPTERGPGDHRWCDARIAALEAEVTRLQGLSSKFDALEAKLAAAMKRIEELEERLGKTSRNSHRPPSGDPPSAKASAKKPPSGRKPGGQPGHDPHPRPLAGPEDVGEFVSVVPKRCPHCGGPVDQDDNCPDRHQVWELPKIALWIVEYLLYSGNCKRCGKNVKGELPEGVPHGGFGPRLVAFVALLTGGYRLSKRKAAALLGDMTGRSISEGSVVACERAVSQAVAAPVAQARAYVEDQPSANVDETSWRQKGKGWLWVAVTPLVTVFLIHLRRSREAAKALLGTFRGTLITDRWSVYTFWEVAKRQLCWAHLKRDFTAIAERTGESRRIGRALIEEVRQLFDWWRKLKEGTIERTTLKRYVAPLKERVLELLSQGTACRQRKTAGTCRELLGLFPAMWTFIFVEGIEPTNNAAERALRHAVIWRKGSFGTQSEEGSRYVERILTVVATLRQQGRDVLGYLVEATEAALCGGAPPSLLPNSLVLNQAKLSA